MSGHSKWATIKRQKGANDAKRGQLFTKLSNAITIAIREGGGVGDPTGNPRLRLAVDAARAANMPKENIDRAIQRAVNKQAGDMEEVMYEGFGPGGFSFIVEAVTDNKNRTTPIIKNIIEKHGGSLGAPGSVSYQFQQRGMVTLIKEAKTLDEIFMVAADSGAEDVEDAEVEALVYTKPEDLGKVRDELVANGIMVKSGEVIRHPIVSLEIQSTADAQKALSFMERLEDLEDVQKVYANFDITDSLLT